MDENLTPKPTSTSQATSLKAQFTTVTPLSRFLAIALFVALPFVGVWIGYVSAPVELIEVEKIVIEESLPSNSQLSTDSTPTTQVSLGGLTNEPNNFIGNPEYVPVKEYKKNAYIVNITSTSVTLDEVEVSGPQVIKNDKVDSATYILSDIHWLTSARGPVTLETIQANPGSVSARLNELGQPLAVIEFVTYENISGEQIDVVTVVELSFSP